MAEFALGVAELGTEVSLVGLSEGIEKAEGEAQSGFGRIGDIIGGALKTGVMAAAAGLVAAIGGIVKGVASNAEFERFETQFGVILGSTEKAKQRLEELAQFGASTPFELPELVKADKVLTAFGLHSEETAKRFGVSGEQILTTIGDVAAGTGVSFEELSVTFGKFASGATGEAISRFQELGIATREEMASWGLEFSKSGQLLTPAREAFTVLEAHVRDKFGGMMAAQSGTFEGMLSNLQDWAGATLRTVSQPIFEPLKGALKSLLETLNSPAVQQGIQNIAGGIAKLIQNAITGGKVLLELGKQAYTWGANIAGQFARGIMQAAAPVIQALQYIGAIIRSWLQPGSPPKLLPQLDEWGAGAATAYMDGWKDADFSAFRSLSSAIEQELKTLVDLGQLSEVDVAPTMARSQEQLARAIATVNAGGEVQGQVWDDLIGAMGPAGPQVAGLVRSYLDLQRATQEVEQAQRELTEVTERYDAALRPLNDQIQGIRDRKREIQDMRRVQELQEKLASGELDAADAELAQLEIAEIQAQQQIDTVERERDAAVDAAQAKVDAAETAQQAAQAQIQTQQGLLDQGHATNQLLIDQGQLLERLAKEAEGAGGGAGGAAGGMADMASSMDAAIQPIQDVAAAVDDAGQQVEAIKGRFTDAITGITGFVQALTFEDAISGLLGTITTLRGALLSWVTESLPGWMEGLSQIAGAVGQTFVNAVPGMLEAIGAFFQALVGQAFEHLPQWIAVLVEYGIKAISWVGEQLPGLAASLGEFYNTMVNWVVDSLPGWGAQLAELGGKIIQWVLDALPGLGTNLGAALGVLLGWIIDTIAEVVPKLAELGVQFIGWVATEVIPKLPGALLTIATAIYNFISEVVQEVGPKLVAVAGKFLNWIETDVIPYLSGKLDAIKTAIQTWVADKAIWAAIELKKLGDAIIKGIISGIEAAAGALFDTLKRIAESALQATLDALEMHSPSRVFAEVGNQIIAGWVEGLESDFPNLLRTFETMGEELMDLAQKIKDQIADVMSDIFSSGADIIRQRVKNREFVDDLGKDVIKAHEKVSKDIEKTEKDLGEAKEKIDADRKKRLDAIEDQQADVTAQAKVVADLEAAIAGGGPDAAKALDKIDAARQKLLDEQDKLKDLKDDEVIRQKAEKERIEELEEQLRLLRLEEEALAEREKQMASLRARQAGLLQQAEQVAAVLFKDDPDRQADFFQLRSKQLQEVAKLEEEWFAARTQEDRDRIEAQIKDIKKAQELELAAFMQRAQQENATFSDLQKQYEDLIAKRDDLTTKRTEKQTQLAKEKDAKRRAELEQEIADLDQQIAGTSALIDEVKQALDPLVGIVTTPPTAPVQGLYGSGAGIAYPNLPNVNGISAGQMAGAAAGANASYTVVLRLEDERSSLLKDLIRTEVREELADAGWRGDTRKR